VLARAYTVSLSSRLELGSWTVGSCRLGAEELSSRIYTVATPSSRRCMDLEMSGRCGGNDAKTQLCGDGGVRANIVRGREIGGGGVGGWRMLEGKMWGAGADGEAGRGGVSAMRVAAARRVPRGVPMGTREGCGVG
jgi:hypothetical protein